MKSTIAFLAILILSFIDISHSLSDIIAHELKCEYLQNPLAIESSHPRLSWTLKEVDPKKQNLTQRAYQIVVASNKNLLNTNKGDLWDTNKVLSDKNIHIPYNGLKLNSRQISYWKVRVWDQNDNPSEFSAVAHWQMGLIGPNDWTAQWIGAPEGMQENATKKLLPADLEIIKSNPGLVPALYLRKNFSLDSKIKEARLYATAQGIHKIIINGQQVSDSHLDPGWTDYNLTIQYQAYDVTNLISSNNAIGAILGTGWFSGYVGIFHVYHHYGADQNLLLQLHIEYENNKTVVIVSDNSWRVTTGPIIYSDLLKGELFYEDRALKGWYFATYDDKSWSPVVTKPIDKKVKLVSDRSEPIRVVQELKPIARQQISPGVYIFDFGQNMVGWVKIKIPAQNKSTRIQIRHAEVLNPDGSLYTANLGSARATDTYVFEGNDGSFETTFEPHFTYHGFRFVEVTGYPVEPQLTDIVGRVVHSDTPINGHFETSNPLVNQLARNIVWGQRGNFMSVPTDCPQRDERLGWMGDAEIFAHTAVYNADVAAFYTNWMRSVRDEQSVSGAFSDFSPRGKGGEDGAPAWGDAGIIVPFTVWRMYGDLQIIEENYESMTKWIDYIESENPDFIWRKRVNQNFGDWLQVGADTPKDVLSTAYFAYDTLLMSKMANAINRTSDAQKYLALNNKICDAFMKAFVNSTDVKIKGDTQTVYLLALAFEMLPKSLRTMAADHLVENIKAHNWHLTTGFVGVGYLCPVLTEFGHNDVAYRLLQTETYPSWLYSVKNNATTIWENWNGWTKEKGFEGSFNHYSLGSVGRWLYQSVAGIDTDNIEVGFKRILIKPNPGVGLTFVTAQYKSINGLIKSHWEIKATEFILKITIPVNTKATVDLTFSKNGKVQEVGSGSYEFKIKLE